MWSKINFNQLIVPDVNCDIFFQTYQMTCAFKNYKRFWGLYEI